MEGSFFVSQIIGLILLATSLGFMLHPHHYQKVFHEVMSQASLKFISGMIPLIFGTLLILTHHTWHAPWDILVGVLCWLIFLKGVCRIVLPNCSDRMTLRCIDHPTCLRTVNVLMLILSLALCYHGFMQA
ncbi:MAG: hypothetical protein NTW08_03335 [Gammaproteobacteria bacterium]|nr:hypothetical protein [Gammaproteobacteria bacterium]